MIVRDLADGKGLYQGYNRVLVPMDFSDISMKALDFGVRFRNFLNAHLHLIHVVETEVLKEMTTRYVWSDIDICGKENWGVNLTLSKMVEPKKLIQEPIVNTLYGEAADRILEYSEVQNMDFIVMGTHGRRGTEKFLVGSVTAEVVAKSIHPHRQRLIPCLQLEHLFFERAGDQRIKIKRRDSEFPRERVLTSHHPTGSNTLSKALLPLA